MLTPSRFSRLQLHRRWAEALPRPTATRSWWRRDAPVWFLAAVLVGSLVALGRPSPAWATDVSGTISTNTTWTLANSPYVMTGDVNVAAGVTLTIQPGVVVKGSGSTRSLIVDGTLSAVGTQSQPITFTSTSDSAPGQWNGIRFGSSAGSSTLKYVNVRYGGDGGASAMNGMVDVGGGTLLIEDSTFSQSSVSGLRVYGGTTGAGVDVTIRRSKFESNGFSGPWKQGNGLYSFNGHVTVEDSAFWSNAVDGFHVEVALSYGGTASTISGSSIWDNKRYGVYIFQDSGLEALGPDGNVAGKPGNTVYDNGTFGFSASESWEQFSILRTSLSVDWRGTYWGPVSFVPCDHGTQNGHLSFAAPAPDPGSFTPAARGPITRSVEVWGPGINWCANDSALVNAPAYEQPDLYFDAPPPTFGGLLPDNLRGCTDCDVGDGEFALTYDGSAGNPIAYTDEPVNTATGSLTEQALDLRLPGPGIPFEWMRSYSSQDTASGALGQGWSAPFDASITVANQTTGELDYHAGTGQHTHFTKISPYTSDYAARGFDGTLKKLGDNTYKMTTRDQRVFTFDTGGKLTQIKPRFMPATNLAYSNGKLSTITDSAGRAISVTYSASDPSLIEKLTLPDGRYVQYGYTSGRLTSVRDTRGKTWTLGYDGSGRLTSIQDPAGNFELQNVQYDGQGRVTSEQNGTGDATTYSYTSSGGYDLTTVTPPGRGATVYKHRTYMLMSVTDPLGRTTSYTYDGMGRRATMTDGRGNTTRYEYDTAGNVVKEVAPSPLSYVVTRTFSATNDLLTEKDGRGNTTTYAYATSNDADYQNGQLKTVTDREGGVTTFKYWTTTSSPTPPATNVGLLKSTTNQRGKTTSNEYDSAGNLTKVTSPLGLKTTMAYDSSGRMTSRRDPRGNVPVPPAGFLTQWTYDDADHIATLTDARGKVTTYTYTDNERLATVTQTEDDGTSRVTTTEYDNANRLWKTTDPRGGVETRLYWPDGQLKSVQSPEGRKTTYDYDSAGQLVTRVEPNGNAGGATASDWTWTYGYDASGNRTSESHPDGGTRQVAYDAVGRPYRWTDALGHITSVSYDANDNIVTRTDGLNHSRTLTYNKLDRVKTETDERGKTTTYAYYGSGELQSVTTPLGNKTTYGIDDDGRTTSTVEPRGNVTGADPAQYTWSYTYDAAGNRTVVSDPLGSTVQYGYDAIDHVTQITDQRGNATSFTYDSLGRLSKLTPPAAGATGTLDTTYAYDAAGNMTSRTDPKGHVSSWTYDLDGLRTSRTTSVGTWNFTYDSNGNLKAKETPAGTSTQTAGDGTSSYSYDRLGRITGVDYSDSTPDVGRTYDAGGRLQTMTDGSGSVAYTFDDADRLTDMVRSGGGAGLNGTLHYDYDNAGNVTSRTLPDGTSVTATFDDDGRLSSVTSAGQTTAFGYDAAGNVTTVTPPGANGTVATRTFDRAGRLTTIENTKAGSILSKFTWTRDAAGNPTVVQTTRGGTDTYDAYEYDARNRLTASCFGIPQGSTNCSGAGDAITYAYDKVSNRTQEVRSGAVGNTGTIDYAYNTADQLTSTTNGGQTTNYTYDANGNEASAGSQTFTHDLENRLTAATIGGTTTTYAYDGDGRRVASTTAGGTDLRYVWDPQAESDFADVALERGPTGTVVRSYVGGPLGAVSFTNASGTFYYLRDPLGSITDVTDANGVAQWRYSYEAFGAERSATDLTGSAPVNRLRFEGEYLDPETIEYHLRARQYDPGTGRFDALDPVESSQAAPFDGSYVYVNDRPTVLTDPTGLDPSFGGATIDCSRNAYLCKLVYAAGYRDRGCNGQCVMKTLTMLAGRGITVEKLVAVANGKAKIVNASDGPDGPGIYFVGYGKSELIRPPKNPTCGLACSFGLAASEILGCHSEASCAAQAALFFIPGAGQYCIAARAARAGAAAKRIYSARVLARAAQESGPFHNFPASFDDVIFSSGKRTVVRNFFNQTKRGLSNDSIRYELPGNVNGQKGVYEIFTRPSRSGRTEVITHRFFRPYR
jgi:RHS repeat-associated protein